jgi:arginase family enzyme
MTNFSEGLKSGMVAVVGIPFDAYSSFMRGPALAPARIRETWNAGACNLCSESGIDLDTHPDFVVLGDIGIGEESAAIKDIELTIAELLRHDVRIISLGGDHAITYPILKSYAKKFVRLDLLHLDAHPDLYDSYDGNRYSNACPFARIMEEKLASRMLELPINFS